MGAKSRRGPKGAGSIFPDKARGGYRVKVPAGRGENGKLKYTWLRARTQGEAVKLRDKHKPQTSGPNLTVAEWARRWLASHEVKAQTRDDYERSVRLRVLPALGARPLARLTTYDVEQAARRWGQAVGAGTVRKTVAALSALVQAAHRAALVPGNVVRPAKKPPAPPARFDLFTAAEVRKILAASLTRPELYPVAVCAATGCRIGEALALRPESYDPATGLLTIDRTRTRERGYSTPKSRHGRRTVRAPLAVRPALAAGVPTSDYATARRRWVALLARLRVRARGLHQLRHTLASHWHDAGVPAAEIAKYLGDTVQVVIATYFHATAGTDPSAVTDAWLQGAHEVPTSKKPKAKPRRG